MTTKRLWLLLWIGLSGTCLSTGAARAATRVGVVECPTALAWLRTVGVECVPIAAGEVTAAPMPDLQVLLLPMDRLKGEDALRAISGFATRGGMVLAVYWGTLARPDRQSDFPAYSASSFLGLKVTGWTLTGPVTVKVEPGAPVSNSVESLTLKQLMMVQVLPDPSAQVLARVLPKSPGTPSILAMRNGNVFYVAANLFHRGQELEGVRRLFFWILDQAAPGLVVSHARAQAGAAMAAVIRAEERLPSVPPDKAEAARRLLDQAREAATRARTLAASEQFSEASTAIEQARELTGRAIQILEGR